MNSFKFLAAVAAGSSIMSMASVADAQTLRFAYGHPPGSILDYAANAFADSVAANEEAGLEVRTFPLSLLNLVETSEGLATGLADIGALMTPIFPKEYPHINLAIELSETLLLGDGPADEAQGVLFGSIITDFVVNDCPGCLDDFRNRNSVFTAAAGSTPYSLTCTQPYVELDDLKDAGMRISGSYWARWSTAVGARPVTVSGNEMLEALTQGVVDCVLLSVPDVYNFGMGDLVTDITEGAPGGIFVVSSAQMNRDTWLSLNTLQRETLMRAAGAAAAATSMRYQALLDEIRAKSASGEVKAKFHQAAPSLVEATQAFVEEDMANLVASYAESYGVTDGDDVVQKINALIEKWRGKLEGVETEEELAQLYWDEIYAKVDFATYGE
ncbi:type 2 periplasmic-binding domain-containing protein [Chachezhania sediminis]|uniref:C4-dicarboxylate ABC transporter substrate-binding protein n=1 Tax=Chachezhania sediminis TaxID=2599291 RepID=UPI00131D360D|nr:C4-dicarboxylate ABC transporter substrate-binding protein [Chachezhania sediminis]